MALPTIRRIRKRLAQTLGKRWRWTPFLAHFPSKEDEKLGQRLDEGLQRFMQLGGQHAHEFFAARPTREERDVYAVQPFRFQGQTPIGPQRYPRPLPVTTRAVAEFSLKRWAEFKARQIASVFLHREISRDRAKKEETEGERMEREARWNAIHRELERGIMQWVKLGGNSALRLRVFWGGAKESVDGTLDNSDRDTMNRIQKMALRLHEEGIPASVELLFADFHARVINKKSEEAIDKYRNGVQEEARLRGFQIMPLSTLWHQHNPLQTDTSNPLKAFEAIVGAALTVRKAREVSLATLGALRARKHSEAVKKGEETPVSASELYTVVRGIERLMLEESQAQERLPPGTVYVDFGAPKEAPHYPQRTLFIWAHGRGHAEKPWADKVIRVLKEEALPPLRLGDWYDTRKLPKRTRLLMKWKSQVMGGKLMPDTERRQRWRRRMLKTAAALGAIGVLGTGTLAGIGHVERKEKQPPEVEMEIEQILEDAPQPVDSLEVRREADSLRKTGVRYPEIWAWLNRSGLQARLAKMLKYYWRVPEEVKKKMAEGTFTPAQLKVLERILERGGTAPTHPHTEDYDKFVYSLWDLNNVTRAFRSYNPHSDREANYQRVRSTLFADIGPRLQTGDFIERDIRSKHEQLLQAIFDEKNYEDAKQSGILDLFFAQANWRKRPLFEGLLPQLKTSADRYVLGSVRMQDQPLSS